MTKYRLSDSDIEFMARQQKLTSLRLMEQRIEIERLQALVASLQA